MSGRFRHIKVMLMIFVCFCGGLPLTLAESELFGTLLVPFSEIAQEVSHAGTS